MWITDGWYDAGTVIPGTTIPMKIVYAFDRPEDAVALFGLSVVDGGLREIEMAEAVPIVQGEDGQ